MTLTVSQLVTYPIKSCQGNEMSEVKVEMQGFALDRCFVVVNKKGMAVTGRTHPKLTRVKVKAHDWGLTLSAPEMPDLAVKYQAFTQDYIQAKVWESDNQAQHCGVECDEWFSEYLNYEVKLGYFGEASNRQIKDYPQPVSFADGYPMLLANTASLDDVNDKASATHLMAQFRPNIVFAGDEAFMEDGWGRIRIGEVEFIVHSPCARCKFTQLDLTTGKLHPAGEPLSVLNQYRRCENGEAYFGQNVIPLNEGVIKVGDEIEILETHPLPVYNAG